MTEEFWLDAENIREQLFKVMGGGIDGWIPPPHQ
jgi:hypothetical protein